MLRLTGAPRRPLVAGKRKLEFAKWKGSHGTQLSGVDLGVKVWGLWGELAVKICELLLMTFFSFLVSLDYFGKTENVPTWPGLFGPGCLHKRLSQEAEERLACLSKNYQVYWSCQKEEFRCVFIMSITLRRQLVGSLWEYRGPDPDRWSLGMVFNWLHYGGNLAKLVPVFSPNNYQLSYDKVIR